MRVHIVQKSRKAYKAWGIKKGDKYYWWKFRFGGVAKSKTYPKRSQLTRSSFLQQLYALQDEHEFDRSDLEVARDSFVEDVESLKDECQDSLDAMPEHLQESSSSGQMLQERIDAFENWVSELESIDTDVDEDLKGEEKEARIEEIAEELSNCECEF